ncbi:hypothetical protein EFE23_06840 [Micromonospora solifontis]|uniref:Uncharacterized protein n=1 Tax=Micromonospora solifontis TaxID=2487138 RepID=A0ABX9WJ04_9ACTN|nr:hypothetical protein EFE23_06840 [Micromonospora solifontis]
MVLPAGKAPHLLIDWSGEVAGMPAPAGQRALGQVGAGRSVQVAEVGVYGAVGYRHLGDVASGQARGRLRGPAGQVVVGCMSGPGRGLRGVGLVRTRWAGCPVTVGWVGPNAVGGLPVAVGWAGPVLVGWKSGRRGLAIPSWWAGLGPESR